MVRIKVTKVAELDDAKHPHNIEEGTEVYGFLQSEPTMGMRFWITHSYSTSGVTKIIDKDTFETHNSRYKITRNVDEAPNCHKCLYKGTMPGETHIRCNNSRAKVVGDPHGIKRGWFLHPNNFDPSWLSACDGFAHEDTLHD